MTTFKPGDTVILRVPNGSKTLVAKGTVTGVVQNAAGSEVYGYKVRFIWPDEWTYTRLEDEFSCLPPNYLRRSDDLLDV